MQKGTPTFFVTFSYNDRSDEMLRILANKIDDSVQIKHETKKSLYETNKYIIRRYPNLVIENFESRIRHIICHVFFIVLLATDIWRVSEFQDRDSIHSHQVVWCKTPFRVEQLMHVVKQ